MYKSIQHKVSNIFYIFTQVFCTFVATFMHHKVGEAVKAEYPVPTLNLEGGSILVGACCLPQDS